MCAGRNLTSVPTFGGAAALETSLLPDPVLTNIILDDLLSNAIKYGDAEQPPSVALGIEPVEDNVVSVSLTVRNAAGSGHLHLHAHSIAAREGARAHGQLGASTSSGDGFPACVTPSPGDVCAALLLSCVKLETVAHFGAMEISGLSMALVDDSMSVRKIMKQTIARAFASCLVPIVAGETHASFNSFPQSAVDVDADVDQNFGVTNPTKAGTDLVRAIRALDLAAGNPHRLILINSANDGPGDLALYRAASADAHVSNSISVKSLHMQVCRLASSSGRFRGRVT